MSLYILSSILTIFFLILIKDTFTHACLLSFIIRSNFCNKILNFQTKNVFPTNTVLLSGSIFMQIPRLCSYRTIVPNAKLNDFIEISPCWSFFAYTFDIILTIINMICIELSTVVFRTIKPNIDVIFFIRQFLLF